MGNRESSILSADTKMRIKNEDAYEKVVVEKRHGFRNNVYASWVVLKWVRQTLVNFGDVI